MVGASGANITIATGDTVRWEWVSGPHNIVSGYRGSQSGLFYSGSPVMLGSFEFKFTFPDVIPYHCEVHMGMDAFITVQGGLDG